MSGHEHHHHDGECHCAECEAKRNGEHEPSSLEQAGGCAVGLTGTITGFNADAEARMAKALMDIGKWVTDTSGCLLGHIKAAVVTDDGKGITLNLTDIENGVEHHGTLDPQEKVRFNFMCAVVDVDEGELRHRMFHAIDDTGLDYELDEHVECHCHDHDHHHHDHDGEYHCHDHHDHDHHDCGCHSHDHHDEGHHHGDGECHCPECEAKKAKESQEKKEKKSFLDRLRRK